MSDTSDKKSIEPQDPVRTVTKTDRPAPERTARVVADAVVQTRNEVVEATQRAGAAVAATMRHFGDAADAAQRGAEKLAEAAQASAASGPRYAQAATSQWQQTASKLMEAAQSTARDMRTLMVLPHQPGSHLLDVHQAVGKLFAGAVQGQFDAAQDLFRLADASSMVHLHHRFLRTYLDTIMQGSAILVQSVRATLRPLEPLQGNEDRHSRIGDLMQRDVRIASPEDTVQQAARLMREEDTGVLPVGDANQLVGIVTDRELALCLAADGRDPSRTKVRDVMTSEVSFVFEDEDPGQVAENMAEQQVRRLPVLNREKQVVGAVSLADLSGKRGRPTQPAANSGPQTEAA
jgi:CBS domain-containing protein